MFEDRVTVSCDLGHVRSTSCDVLASATDVLQCSDAPSASVYDVECNSSGQWMPEALCSGEYIPKLVFEYLFRLTTPYFLAAVDCSEPILDESVVTSSSFNTTYLSNAALKCKTGYSNFTGDDVVTCGPYGSWLTFEASCQRKNSDH